MNYQRALYEVTKEHLVEHRVYDRLAKEASTVTVPPTGLIYLPAPRINDEPPTDDPVVLEILREFNPAERDARVRVLGDPVKEFVFQAE